MANSGFNRINAANADCVIAGRPFMLAEEMDQGKPTGRRMWRQERSKFTPGTQPSPAAEPYTLEPELEVAQVYATWRNGVGFREQPDITAKDANGIFYGRYLDKGGIYLGPSAAVTAFTPVTTDSTNGGNQFIEFTVGGTRTLYCAMGRYLLKRVNDTSWTISVTLAAGSKITGLAKFRGQRAAQYMYIAYQNSSGVAQVYRVFDGVDATDVANVGGIIAVDFCTYRESLWMLNQETATGGRWEVQQTVDGDTLAAAATWSGAFVIADATETCTNLVVNQDRLFIRSTLGLLGVNANELDAQQITGDAFKTQFQTPNSCRPVAFGQFVITQIASSFFAYDAQSGAVNEIGVNVLKNIDSGIAVGVHTTAAPYRLWTLYTWTYSAVDSKAYLWRWGEHELIDTMYSPVPYGQFVPCLYGSLYEQTAQVTGSIVSEIGGTTPRLYWVDVTGVISFMPLSRYSANPYSDSAVPINITNNALIYLPACTARNPAEIKAASGITLTGKNFGSTNFWTASYRTDQTSAYGNSSNLDNGGQYQSPVSQRNNFIAPATGVWLDVLLTCANTSSTAPPLLKAAIIYEVIRPIFKWTYTAVVRVGASVKFNSGASRGMMFDVPDDRTFLENIAGAQGMVNITTPDGSTVAVFVTNVIFEWNSREPLEQVEWYATIRMVEHRPRTLPGRYSRLNIFTYQYLEQYNYAQLAAL